MTRHRQIKVALDFDDCLGRTTDRIIKVIGEKNPGTRTQPRKDYDYASIFPDLSSAEITEQIWDTHANLIFDYRFLYPNFDLDPAILYLIENSHIFKVDIVTANPFPTFLFNWLNLWIKPRFGRFYSDVNFTNKKHRFGHDVLIDDIGINCRKFVVNRPTKVAIFYDTGKTATTEEEIEALQLLYSSNPQTNGHVEVAFSGSSVVDALKVIHSNYLCP